MKKMSDCEKSEALEKIILQTPITEYVPINKIDKTIQMRRTFEHIELFAENIDVVGLINAISINHTTGNEHYNLIAGERRLRACKILAEKYGNPEFPIRSTIYKDLSKEERDLIQHVENSYVPVPPTEAAESYAKQYEIWKRMYEAKGKSLTLGKFATLMDRSSSTITEALRYVTLPERIKKLVEDKRMLYGVAAQIARISDSKVRDYLAFKCETRKYDENEMRRIVNTT
ncbi:MAG: ParB N-terminal domain-containing protein, partial [Nanoarchaeota archaeon]